MFENMGGWIETLAASALFLVSHAIPARPRIKARLIGIVGRHAYFACYSLISLVVLVWLIAAAGSAPYVELWPQHEWHRAVPAAGMLVAVLLAVLGLTSPNPLSIAIPRSRPFVAEHPGVVGFVRHPILWAALIWALCHIVANGDVSHVLMFGLFAGLSVFGMVTLDRRKRRLLGLQAWQGLAQRTSNWPLVSLSKGWRPRLDNSLLLRFVASLLIYGALVAGHALFAGVSLL